MTANTRTLTGTRSLAAALIASLSLLLTGCFMTPGKFTSELVLMDEDRFTFTYDGEIFFLGLANLAEMGAASEEFEADDCYDAQTYESRECTAAEIAEQREVWEMNAPIRAAKAQEQAQQMSAMMGGIDPSDPQASAELVELLSRQKGWESVVDKGDGVFDVRYSVSGTLSHDFMFPVIEGFPSTNPFVQIILREGGVVRVNAPGFSSQNEGNPMGSMMGSMAGLGGMAAMAGQSANGPDMPDVPTLEGTFTIVTNGQIRANNTDEGANPTPTGQMLVWDISPRTKAAPTALIDLSR
ncbi:hypothetical protein INR77_08050 [Erythrobacter sp. SCSIO 43205]|uniref:hypothetical protein n=1 Tax=Erythrobacter sp. SCSIO 43205 TaxID=2779361 RepID=UPI001CA94C2E|nr:hypothetical protein [Erythrobacter sp. SCSIO 43205]UAB76820.1 hypothetical protein INR77_08050 [Erythrobacter sp. SCSIO 43205]